MVIQQADAAHEEVSPRFDGGSGLKLGFAMQLSLKRLGLPSFRRGERIETM